MDNAAFRSLVSKPVRDENGTSKSNTFKKPAALGSRARSSIPMTPRNVPGYNSNREFARQVAEHTSSTGEPPLKKFKSSAAPKGAKFGAGYVDRAQLRKEDETDANDDKAERLKNLEEQLKLGQIELAQFEKLREQIGVGGDVGSTHLVKGLDWKLLARVKRGEDINSSEGRQDDLEDSKVDVDEELERALEKDVVMNRAEEKEEATNDIQGPVQALTRDEILRRFREQRSGPPVPAAPVLNERFKKVASSEKPGKKKFVESVNGRRREVLVIKNKDGTTKRKTRWLDPEDTSRPEQQPLGMEVPAEMAAKHKAMLEAEAAEDANEDIFADAGDDYDPLAGIASSDDEASEGEHMEAAKPAALSATQKRNYFSAGKDEVQEDESSNKLPNDPTIMAALKRAAQIRQSEEGGDGESGGLDAHEVGREAGAKSSAFLAKLKEQERQDAADLDYGFGENRFGDEEDDEAGPLYDEDEEGDGKKKGGAGGGRKRGPKKRKGNKDNVQDVMSVLEGRNKKS